MITARDIIDFSKKPGTRTVTWITGLFVAALIFAFYFNAPDKPMRAAVQEKKSEIFVGKTEKTGISYNDIEAAHTQKPAPSQVAAAAPVKKEPVTVQKPMRQIAENPPIVSLYERPPQKDEYVLGDRFAPYGRLVECQLVITVDSAMAETPIIGLITKDVWHAGKKIIPAGAEVHGRAIPKPVRDRVMTDKNWVVVWRTKDDDDFADNGKELRITGYALTKEAMLTNNSWHLHDGSAGIRGEVIKSSQMTEIMAYAAEFLATFTDNLVQEQVTVTDWGQTTTTSGSTKDAVNEGIAAAARKYADRLMEQLKTEGYFVRCAGGTEFYLYITDVINMDEADLAGTKLSTIKK